MEFILSDNADLIAELSKLPVEDLYKEVDRIEAQMKALRNRKYWANFVKAEKERALLPTATPSGPAQTIRG